MDDVKTVDLDILRELHRGARTQGFLVDETGYSRTYVNERLKIMQARGWLQNVHSPTSLWELTDDAPPEDMLDSLDDSDEE